MNQSDVIKEVIRNSTSVWFESQHCRIFGKDRAKGLIRPRCNYLQAKVQRVIEQFEELELPVRIIGLKPRQKGSTTFFSAQDYCFLRRHSASAIVIGGQYSQVSECWDMLQTYAKNDTFDWDNHGEINAKSGSWSNGSKLRPETAKDAVAGIGGTHQVLHAFEVARWSRHGVANASGVLSNITKCVPQLPGTMITLESTAEGSSGEFYERFVGAVDAEKFISGEADVQAGSYVRVFAAWFEFSDSAMRLTDEQKRRVENTLDSDMEYDGEKELIANHGNIGEDGVTRLGVSVQDFDVWEQLAWRRFAIHEECEKDKDIFDRDYPSSWQVAFQKSGKTRFNGTGIGVLKKSVAKTAVRVGIIEEARGNFAFRSTDANESTHKIWEAPTPGYRYILPIDPMTGASQTSGMDPDFHAAGIIRAGFWNSAGRWVKPCLAARVIPCQWDIDRLEQAAWRLARYYGNTSGCKIVVEMNQDRGITELLKLRSADLYMRELFNKREEKFTKALGYQTNERTRETLVEKVAGEIREWDAPGRGIDIWDIYTITQLENFVRKENGRCEAAEGFHDDDVFMLGLGLELIEHATTYWPPVSSFGLPPDLREPPRNGTRASTYS